jgi:hypothetical protein
MPSHSLLSRVLRALIEAPIRARKGGVGVDLHFGVGKRGAFVPRDNQRKQGPAR